MRSQEVVVKLPFPKVLKKLSGKEFFFYYLNNQTAVLAICPFSSMGSEEFLMAAPTFVMDGIIFLTVNHYKRLVTDVTGNGAGFNDLGIDTMCQLFPDNDHFFAINMQWSPTLVTMLTDGLDANGTSWD